MLNAVFPLLSRRPAFLLTSLERLADILANTDLAVVNPQMETAVRIGADPGFIPYRGAVPAVVAERNEDTGLAFQTFRELTLAHYAFPSPGG